MSHAACMGYIINAYKVLFGKPTRKIAFLRHAYGIILK
jgi:hypothetical protein